MFLIVGFRWGVEIKRVFIIRGLNEIRITYGEAICLNYTLE